MKNTHILIGTLAALSLSACGGGDDSGATLPPTGGTPAPVTPAATDFNAYAVLIARQQDAASERAIPLSLDNQAFAFDESPTAFASVFPAN